MQQDDAIMQETAIIKNSCYTASHNQYNELISHQIASNDHCYVQTSNKVIGRVATEYDAQLNGVIEHHITYQPVTQEELSVTEKRTYTQTTPSTVLNATATCTGNVEQYVLITDAKGEGQHMTNDATYQPVAPDDLSVTEGHIYTQATQTTPRTVLNANMGNTKQYALIDDVNATGNYKQYALIDGVTAKQLVDDASKTDEFLYDVVLDADDIRYAHIDDAIALTNEQATDVNIYNVSLNADNKHYAQIEELTVNDANYQQIYEVITETIDESAKLFNK